MRNMNEMSREYELWEYINTTFIFFVKHMYTCMIETSGYTACRSSSVS